MDHLMQHDRPVPVTGAVMREVLGHFATGVVIITGIDDRGPLGFTCQSFASLSLDPPLITFSPARISTTWARLRATKSFCVNVLAADYSHHSRAFARSGTDKFAGVDWSPAPSGAPVLDGVSAWVDATLEDEHEGGDHTIVVGRVTDLGAYPARLPLLFYRGGYTNTSPIPL